jgi:AcrR family transcriptional regulator
MHRSALRPAQQDRSRQTEARLLEAAEAILEERGLERAAIPEIAKRAGVSPASIYRRFTDKDGLLREVFERFFERSIESNRAALDPGQWHCKSLEASVRTLVRGMVAAYRQKRGLLRAVITYGEQHPNSALRRRTLELRKRSVAAIEGILLLHAREIKHPEPQRAVHFGVQLIALALKERIVPAGTTSTSAMLSDEELAEELSRMLLGYLRS